jgi:zinc transport system substrate-binding protein
MPLLRRLALLLLLLPSLPAGAVEVLASIHPLALIATAVVQGQGTVRQLVPDGVSSHDYALRPSDRVNLADAGIVLWVGPVHERFLVKLLNGSPARQVVAQSLPGLVRLPQRGLDDAAPLPGTLDAHLWLNPANAITIARALAEALAQIEPANAARYRANAASFATTTLAAQTRLKAQLAPLGARPYLAWHDAYQYLEAPLGLHFAGAVTAGHDQPAGARHMALVASRIRSQHIGCLLAEPGFDPALTSRIASGSPLKVISIDELFASATSYTQGLENMAAGIRSCLGG